MKAKPRQKLKFRKALRAWRSSTIPFALLTASGALALLGADRWILYNLAEQRDIDFKQQVSRISLQLNENILLENYIEIDNLLVRIMENGQNITCLVVSGKNENILSMASRTQAISNASIHYGDPPARCRPNAYDPNGEDYHNGNFYAASTVRNDDQILGYVFGHAVDEKSDLALIRSIEFSLLGAFIIAFLPALGLLIWSHRRQLELEQEKTAKVSTLNNQLQEEKNRTYTAFEGSNDGWLEWDLTNDLCIPSPKMRDLTGISMQHSKAEIINQTINEYWQMFVVKEDQERYQNFLKSIKQELRSGNATFNSAEVRIKPLGQENVQTLQIEAVITEAIEQRPTNVALIANNITHEKEQQRRINHLAFYDTLTGLRNRFSVEEELQVAEAGLKRKDYRLAIFAIDIDKFKFLNDSHGHAAGDQFLIQVADRVKSCLRPTDFAARIGGDEFIILCRLPYDTNQQSEILARAIGNKLLSALSDPYRLQACTAHNTCSIGICLDNTDPKSTATLLDKADIALYKAKELGRNCLFLYQAGMASAIISKAATAESLKQLIKAGESSLWLQPIVKLSSDQTVDSRGRLEVVGYESLFRCPKLQKSIPYIILCAEEAGIINSITESILDKIEIEFKSNTLEKTAYVSINISPEQFLEHNFPLKFLKQLRTRGIDPNRICIEITETAVLKDTKCALAHMKTLKDVGIRFYLDDFGTGYASIELLRKLPFDCLKIDRSYIKNTHKEVEIKIIKSVVDMAQAFDIELIGEGVETIGQKAILESLGCQYAQGFLFGNDGVFLKGS